MQPQKFALQALVAEGVLVKVGEIDRPAAMHDGLMRHLAMLVHVKLPGAALTIRTWNISGRLPMTG